MISFFGDDPRPFFPGPDLSLSRRSEEGMFPMHSTFYFLYTTEGDHAAEELIEREESTPIASTRPDGSIDYMRCGTYEG